MPLNENEDKSDLGTLAWGESREKRLTEDRKEDHKHTAFEQEGTELQKVPFGLNARFLNVAFGLNARFLNVAFGLSLR